VAAAEFLVALEPGEESESELHLRSPSANVRLARVGEGVGEAVGVMAVVMDGGGGGDGNGPFLGEVGGISPGNIASGDDNCSINGGGGGRAGNMGGVTAIILT